MCMLAAATELMRSQLAMLTQHWLYRMNVYPVCTERRLGNHCACDGRCSLIHVNELSLLSCKRNSRYDLELPFICTCLPPRGSNMVFAETI